MYSIHCSALLVNKLSAELCCLNIITFCMVCNPYIITILPKVIKFEEQPSILYYGIYGVFNFFLSCQFALIMSVY